MPRSQPAEVEPRVRSSGLSALVLSRTRPAGPQWSAGPELGARHDPLLSTGDVEVDVLQHPLLRAGPTLTQDRVNVPDPR